MLSTNFCSFFLLGPTPLIGLKWPCVPEFRLRHEAFAPLAAPGPFLRAPRALEVVRRSASADALPRGQATLVRDGLVRPLPRGVKDLASEALEMKYSPMSP